MVPVGDGHELYVQDWGNEQASVTIFRLHGGPGGSSSDSYKTQYDPLRQRVVFHDQRGCGKSVPYGSLENNTTDDLIEDIRKIADKLDIEKFVLHGTSWGATLALAFAIKYPQRTSALVIGGVFTATRAENEWLNKGLMKTFYPDVWQRYLETVPEKYGDDPSAYHIERVLRGSAAEQKESGYAFEHLEGGVMFFHDTPAPGDKDSFDPSGIRIELHYLSNGCFMPEGYIATNAQKLTMPVHIVQGRYDMVCPPQTAYELSRKLPDARLYWTLSNHRVEHEGKNIFRAIFDGMTR